MKFILNGKEYELDLFDVDIAENFENEIFRASDKLEAENKKKYQRTSELMRTGCNIIFDCFDNIFGKGASENIFDRKSNYKLCLKTFKEIQVQYIKILTEEMAKEVTDEMNKQNDIIYSLGNKQNLSVSQKNKQNYQNYINTKKREKEKSIKQKKK